MLVFSKQRSDDMVVANVNTDLHSTHESIVHLDLATLGLNAGHPSSPHTTCTPMPHSTDVDNYVRFSPD